MEVKTTALMESKRKTKKMRKKGKPNSLNKRQNLLDSKLCRKNERQKRRRREMQRRS